MMPKFAYKIVIQRALLALTLLSLLSLVPQSNVSAAYAQQTQLLPSDPAAANQMGYAVEASGFYGGLMTVMGVPGDADRGADSGAVYLFFNTGGAPLSIWPKFAKLTASDASPGDRFGSSVSFFGNYVAVGAPGYHDGQGAVYIFEYDIPHIWVQRAILTAEDGAAGDEFGASLFLGLGNTFTIKQAAIGSPGKGAGAVYLFEVDENAPIRTWTQMNKLIPSNGAAGDRFGSSVFSTLLNNNFAVVGAPNDDDTATDSGAVYVYLSTGSNIWSQEAKLTASDGAAGDHLGTSLTTIFTPATNTVTVVTGAPNADSPTTDAGAVYTFTRNNSTSIWSQESKLIANDADANDHFGTDVDNYGDYRVIVGAPDDDQKGVDAGAAYVFNYSLSVPSYTWTLAKKLTGANSAAGDHYGFGVAMDALAFVGAPFEVINGETGGVYVYNPNSNWTQVTKHTADLTPIEDHFGSSFAIDDDIAIVGANADADGGIEFSRGSGAAYIFTRSGRIWSQQTRLTSGDSGFSGEMGDSVAISGNTVLISIPNASSVEVYVQNGTQWERQARLADPLSGGDFGTSIGLFGNTAVVASNSYRYFFTRSGSTWILQNKFPGSATSITIAGDWAAFGDYSVEPGGAVHLYHWDGANWVAAGDLTPPADSFQSGQDFGWALDIDDTRMAIGAPKRSIPGMEQIGSVYIFTYDGSNWIQEAELKRSNPTQQDQMGLAVSIDGDQVAAGMSSPTSGNEQAILFHQIGGVWEQLQGISRNSTNEDFGGSVSLENGELWVTAPLQTVSGASGAGTVYAYALNADLTIELADVPGVIAGFDMTYEVTVTNNGQENTTGVSIVDTLPANMTFLDASAGCSPVANVVTCAVGNLNIGDSETVFIDVNINGTATGVLTNQATVTSALPDPNTADNTATQETQIVPAPGIPTPLTPADGSTTTNTTPTFTWTPVSGIFYYDVQLDIMDPPQGIYSGFNIAETFKPPAPLLYMTYYWRVRSVDKFGVPSPWSDTFILIVNAGNTVAPIRTVSQDALPTVSWSPVTWATAYEVEIAADSQFETVVLPSGELPPTATSYTSIDELPNGTWYWRVRARKEDGVTWSAWSTVETLQVIVP